MRPILAVLIAVTALLLGACKDDTAGPETGLSLGELQTDEDTVLDDPQTFPGQEVTVSAEVSFALSPYAFVIAGTDETTVEPILVVTREPVDVAPELPVRVTGFVAPIFNVPRAEEYAGDDFEDDLYGDFNGEPYIQASRISLLGTAPR